MAFIPTACEGSTWKALTFLNGFEVASVSPKVGYWTPFEVQVVVTAVGVQGLTLLISTTSATQVHSLFISYIAYDSSAIPNVNSFNFVYNKYIGISSSVIKLEANLATSSAAVFGLNGFIVGNSVGPFGITLSYDPASNSGLVTSSSNYYYLSANGFFLLGGPCGQCKGYSINYNGNCLASCPAGTNFDGKTCVTCQNGQIWSNSACVTPAAPVNPSGPTGGSGSGSSVVNVISCPGGTYWDGQQLRCLPCAIGCATCVDCDTCASCSLGFFQPSANAKCQEVCGDGKRFVLGCDDGNSVNGDGCSSTCQVEVGWNCQGGSPSSADQCSRGAPAALTFTSTGQSHTWGKVIVNVKVNYLPQSLIVNANDCKFNCNNVLLVKIISGDGSANSITSSYIPNSAYSFSVEVNFGKEPFGIFTAQISLNPAIAAKYFVGVNTSATLNVNVNPAAFSLSAEEDHLDG